MSLTSSNRLAGAGLTLAALLAAGAAFGCGAPQPSAEVDPKFARELLAARQANAEAQRQGRPSVWMAVPQASRSESPVSTGDSAP